MRDRVGIDRICWEADYPHSDSTWPTSPEYLMKSLDQVPGGVPDSEIDTITHRNAMNHFRFDPFVGPPAGGVHGRRVAGASGGRWCRHRAAERRNPTRGTA